MGAPIWILARHLIMRLLLLACLLCFCSAAKISPFVPQDLTRQDLDIARTNYHRALAGRDKGQGGRVREGEGGGEGGEAEPDETNTAIPIVVGSVLGGLIVVVLVSYFIVRARRTTE